MSMVATMAYRYALVKKPDKKDFNSAPFIHNKTAVQQGCVTSEPYEVEKQGGFRPNIFLLSDYGYSTYSTLIETRRDLIEKKPDLVQRFVDALSNRLVRLSLRR
jgi:NMT1/THI5 like